MNSFSRKLKLERREAQEHRGRPRDQHQDNATAMAPEQAVGETSWPGQQAEQNEHHDLRQPGNGVEKDDHGIVCACLHVADDQPREINGEKAGRVHDFAKAKITSALTATNGACRPCASVRRLSTNAMIRPPKKPMMQPRIGFTQERHQRVRPALIADQQNFDQQQWQERSRTDRWCPTPLRARRGRAGAASDRGH